MKKKQTKVCIKEPIEKYLKEIGGFSLLSQAQEIALGQRIRKGDGYVPAFGRHLVTIFSEILESRLVH